MNSKSNPTLKSSKIRVGITLGDPSGIGPAITLKALRKLNGLAEFVVIGDEWVLNKSHQVTRSPGHQYKIIDLHNVRHKDFIFGEVRAEYGRAAIEYLDKALELIKNKEIDCLVTCPISKEAVNKAGFHYSGHTEYLARRTKAKDTVMLLLNRDLRLSLITRHIPLKAVARALNKNEIYKNIILLHRALKELFNLKKPRIVVCGLNPHASDNGLIGDEENKIIKPVIAKLRKKNKARIDGPLSADVAIHLAKEKKYDAVIAMYHDQALIPLKLSDNESGVNMTLGLSFIRTSPLHGTAFDIARTPRLANPNSLIAAVKLAVKCASNQKRD